MVKFLKFRFRGIFKDHIHENLFFFRPERVPVIVCADSILGRDIGKRFNIFIPMGHLALKIDGKGRIGNGIHDMGNRLSPFRCGILRFERQ